MATIYVHSEKPLTAAIRRKIESIGVKLERHFNSLVSVAWTVKGEKSGWLVKCRVQGRSGVYLASAIDDSVRAAMDTIDSKLLRQRRRVRRKQVTKRQRQRVNR